MIQSHPSHSDRRADSSEVHLCDNYAHLLVASADLATRAQFASPRAVIVFIDDQLPLSPELGARLTELTGAEIVCVSDRSEIESFAKFPRRVPGMLRRNLSWNRRGIPIRPSRWTPEFLSVQHFATAFVYHPGFFLSKVLAGRADRVVMRDSGYANYVRHRVPWPRRPGRLLAGRSPRFQTWGEERWVDRIEVARPDLLPGHVRHKASHVNLDDLMGRLPDGTAHALADAFWGNAPALTIGSRPTALVLTQPLDQLGICSIDQKRMLYRSLASRLDDRGFDVVAKPHPREVEPALPDAPSIPASFPIEAWAWRGGRPFDAAISLNSASLVSEDVTFARQRLQLIPADRFYPRYWNEWDALIEEAFDGITFRSAQEPSLRCQE